MACPGCSVRTEKSGGRKASRNHVRHFLYLLLRLACDSWTPLDDLWKGLATLLLPVRWATSKHRPIRHFSRRGHPYYLTETREDRERLAASASGGVRSSAGIQAPISVTRPLPLSLFTVPLGTWSWTADIDSCLFVFFSLFFHNNNI